MFKKDEWGVLPKKYVSDVILKKKKKKELDILLNVI